MNPLDTLLADSLSSMITEKLGKKTVQKIESRLKDRYGLTLVQAIRDFHVLDATLREFFGPGADEMEKDFLSNFVTIDKSKRNQNWITIQDQKLGQLILESFGDPEKKSILNSSLSQPNVIMEILNNCNMPKSTGYRIIKDLIQDGFLTEKGFSLTKDGKKVSKYTSLIKNVKIDIQGDSQKLLVKVQINEDFLKQSYLLKVMMQT